MSQQKFFDQVKELDQIAASPPEVEPVRRFVDLVRDPALRQYAFDHLQDPRWLQPLQVKNCFASPPAVVRDDAKGTLTFPLWPESRYLARMAQAAPETVLEIILRIPETDNVRVHEDLLDAALALPPALAARIAIRAQAWVSSPYHFLLPEKMGKLIVHLSKGGQIEPALGLAHALLALLPDPRRVGGKDDDPYRLSPEPVARFDAWNYQQILKMDVPILVEAARLPALDLLCDLLETAVRLSRSRDEDSGPDDYSYIWRPAIEDHSQNLGLSLKEALVVAVRDAAAQLVTADRALVPTLVSALEGRRWHVFVRLALHLLRHFPDAAPQLISDRLTNRHLFDEIGLRHEYTLLLKECFTRVMPEVQATILSWIEGGPDRGTFAARFKQIHEAEPTEEHWNRFANSWRLEHLAPIRDVLSPEWRRRYDTLVAQCGEADHPEFPSYHAEWHGPTSPKTSKELRSMSVEEIVRYLREWKPIGGFTDPTPEGIGRELTALISSDPQFYATKAATFQLTEPTYVRSILWGFREAAGREVSFDWSGVLDLCAWAVGQPRDIPPRVRLLGDKDPDWGWTRKTIADLLGVGFKGGIPAHLRDKAWRVLLPLTIDPDPTADRDGGPSGSDAANLSINTVRGEAMHSVVQYALWIRRQIEKESDANTRLARGFLEMPEVAQVLTDRLNPTVDSSPAIRSVYGQWFPWLLLLGHGWATHNAALIFPADESSRTLWNAAWDTYVRFCAPYDNVFEALRTQYMTAVERLVPTFPETRGLEAPEFHLAQHLVTFYWRGKLGLESDGLLSQFYLRAPLAVRAHAIDFIGRSLHDTKGEVDAIILERLRRLWQYRLDSIQTSENTSLNSSELVGFGWWFASGKFDNSWSVAQLKRTLMLAQKAELDSLVVERLAQLSPTMPLEAVECLTLIVEGDKEGWGVHGWHEHARAILTCGLKSGDERARAAATDLVHRLGARGYLDFRALLSMAGA